MYELVLWDFDGTLCDTHDAIRYSLTAAVTELGQRSLAPRILGRLLSKGMGLEEAVEEVLSSPAEQTRVVERYRAIYAERGWKRERLFPGTSEALQALRAKGVTQVVVSNKKEEAVVAALDRFGIREFVDFCIGSSPGFKKKPHPMMYSDRVLDVVPSARPERTLMIGDTETDLRFATNIGAASCWAAYGYGSSESCEALMPRHVILSPNHVVPLMR